MNADDMRELRLRRALDKALAREKFRNYYQRMTGFTPALHHLKICNLLQSMEEDRCDRAMVFLPPRAGKSTLCSMLFPSWILGRHPGTSVMSGVHTQHFAEKIGGRVRNYFRNPLFPFDVDLASDSQAKSTWATTAGGEYNGFGLMGGSTHGNPAEWLINDDLIKGRKMAMSAHMREEAWDSYKADMLTRLQGRRKQLKVTTRWHNDDVAGRILPEDFNGASGWYADRETGEKWYVLCIPARAEMENDPVGRKIGDYLWPEEMGEKAFTAAEKRGGYIWSALYQQRPSPEEGLMFKDEHIKIYDNLPSLDTLRFYITSDYAVTAEAGATDPDYTVHAVWAVDPEWNVYLVDAWRGRTTSDKWVKELIRLIKRYAPIMVGEEAGQILKSVGPFLDQQLRDEKVYVHRRQYTSSTSKEARAQGILGLASMGKLFLPRGHPLTALFRAELLAFPGGKHDDMVDTASLMGRMLGDIIAGRKPKGGSLPQTETLMDLFAQNETQ